METSYLKTLELDKIIARAAEGCVCKESREKLLAIEPQCDPDEVRYALEQTDAINSLLIKNGSPRFGGVEGVSQLAARAVKGGVLSMGELLMVAGALRNFQNLVSWYGSSEHDALPTDDLFYALAPQPGLEQQISSAILAPDAMADTASHTLNDLRKKIRATENSIRESPESPVLFQKTTNSEISTPNKKAKMKQKNLITVVTDHQLTADTIARAIGANEKHEGYYLGNGYAVTWTNGQLVEATFSPQESFVLSTTMESRLAYAHNFKFAMRNYDELVGYKKSAEDIRQLDTIKALWKMSLTVVNAMRPDITGDLDFLSLYYFIGCPVDTRRAWLPVLTKKAIVHAVNHGPQNRKEYEKWLEESIYNAIVQAAEENAGLKGSPAVEEISASDAAKDAECAGVPAPAPGEKRDGDNYIGLITDRCPLFNLPPLSL